MAGLEEWSSRRRSSRKAGATADRIRLTGPLRRYLSCDPSRRSRTPHAMRTSTIWLALAVLTGAGLMLGRAGAGPRRPRAGPPGCSGGPGDGRTPEFPEPTITQYKPRTTLKTVEHPVPQGEVPGDRHPQPPADGDVRRADGPGRRRDGRQQPAGAGQRQRRLGQPAGRGRAGAEGLASSRAGWCRSPTSTSATSAPGWGGQGGGPARGRRQGRRARPRRDLQGARPALPQGRRLPPEARRSGARSGVGRVPAGSASRC